MKRHDYGQGYAQRNGYPVDVDQGDVAFSAFDAAQVGAVQAGSVGQLLLGKTLDTAKFRNVRAESDQQFFPVHRFQSIDVPATGVSACRLCVSNCRL